MRTGGFPGRFRRFAAGGPGRKTLKPGSVGLNKNLRPLWPGATGKPGKREAGQAGEWPDGRQPLLGISSLAHGKREMNPTFTLIFSSLLIGLYILGIVLYTSNRAPWRKIIVNEFLVFGILGFLGLWIVIHFSLR